MKKLFTLLSLSFFSIGMIAQNFVSTIPENRNIILEEFTGIHCGFCPDGHVVAQGIYDNNPGDVVLVNIHTGSYATPSAGEPDFRTPFGDLIDQQAGVAGYPAGTVNRHQFTMTQGGGTAMSRGDWAAAGGQILALPSYVNVAAEATIDVSSRVLTVVVEAYYTGNPATGTVNNLNIALLQNNVPGPQSGAANYNPGAIITGPWNPTYNHQHMLRHLLTGQWGENMNNVSMGSFFTNTYTYTIPADLNGVVYDLFNLEVAVFISEGQQEIITGNMANMTHQVPAGVMLVDLQATSSTNLPSSYCDNNIVPEITVTNNSNITVDTFEVGYTLNANSPVTQLITTPLAPGASTNIAFPSITVPSGTNSISFSALTAAGSSFIDNIPSNNIASSGSFSTLSPTPFSTAITEDFEGYALATTAPSNSILENPQNNWVGVIDGSYTQGMPVGGYGQSPNSYRFRLASFSVGNSAKLIWEKIDLSGTVGNSITFDYAHANMSPSNQDVLQILVSTDCGVTWNIADQLIGSALTTTTPVASGNFYPNSTTWSTHTADISNWDGSADVMVAFNAISNGGNNLYIDNIETAGGAVPHSYDCIQGNCVDPGTGNGYYSSLTACMSACVSTSIDESNSNIEVYPNPAKNILNIDGVYESIMIYDMFGKLLIHSENEKQINVKSLSPGIYFISIVVNQETIIKKISIE